MKDWNQGIIAWFARNPVAANLLMTILIVAGIATTFSIKKEIQPKLHTNIVNVVVPVLGGAPREVEEGVVIKIEEAIQDIDGIDKMTSVASEGSARISVEIASSHEVIEVMNEIKSRVDSISTFPALAERPQISRLEFQQQVMFVQVSGELDEWTMKAYADSVREELLALPGITRVQMIGDRDYEIAVEVTEDTLRKYGLTLSQVAAAISRSSLDLPGGVIRTEGGDVRVRTQGQAYTGRDFEQIVLLTRADGTRLLLGDIATVSDGFVERAGFARFDREDSFGIQVFSVGDQSELKIAETVRNFVDQRQATLPAGVKLTYWVDISHYLQGRLDMMVKNLLAGALLVFVVLTLFLRLKVAFWVIVGLPVAFLGAIWVMTWNPFNVTLNMTSLFGLIVVLGIVVDDAIIIGESVYTKIRADGHSLENVVRGARRVAMPATFGVLTTIAAFLPLLMVGGFAAAFWEAIGFVVMLCLVFSLVESKLILPAHLAHMKLKHIAPEDRGPLTRVQRFLSDGLERFAQTFYRPLLATAIRNRGITAALFLAVLIAAGGLLAGGQVRFNPNPQFAADFIQVNIQMNDGTPASETLKAVERTEAALEELDRQVAQEFGVQGRAVVHHFFAWLDSETSGRVIVELTKEEDSLIPAPEVLERWRQLTGEIPGARELVFQGATGFSGGADVAFRLVGDDLETLSSAAKQLTRKLGEYDGLYNIRNTFSSGSQELRLDILPEAEVLGISRRDLAQQVREAFYGAEAQRIQRGKDEIRVMVRYPRAERESIASLENMYIITPAGDEVPFAEVAAVSFDESYTDIRRVNRKRVVLVTAAANAEKISAEDVTRDIESNFLPNLLARHPGVESQRDEGSLETQRLLERLQTGSLLAGFLIFALMAVPLKSYFQPLIIMSVIPFGLIGAIFGHLIHAEAMTIVSLFGVVALAGVVVNDSLIMMDFINKAIAEGKSRVQAALDSGVQRFRAIMLTSLTTFFGLAPIVYFETSLQAKVMIPMAISLAYGILFATVITLFLIPCLFLLSRDFAGFMGRGLGDVAAFGRHLGGLLRGRNRRRGPSGKTVD